MAWRFSSLVKTADGAGARKSEIGGSRASYVDARSFTRGEKEEVSEKEYSATDLSFARG